MTHYSKVHVSYSDGSKPQGKKVTLGLPMGMTKPAFTDKYGTALISHESTGRATVYVDGKNVGSFQAPGETSVYI